MEGYPERKSETAQAQCSIMENDTIVENNDETGRIPESSMDASTESEVTNAESEDLLLIRKLSKRRKHDKDNNNTEPGSPTKRLMRPVYIDESSYDFYARRSRNVNRASKTVCQTKLPQVKQV